MIEVVEDGDSFIEFLEERNEGNEGGSSSSSLPHLRSNCNINKFTEPHFMNICENCYCYVCDTRASDCKHWVGHCRATNEGPLKIQWKKYKDDELDKQRAAEGRPKKKLKTILNFFKKAENVPSPQPAPKALFAAVLEESSSVRAVSPDTYEVEKNIPKNNLGDIAPKGVSAPVIIKQMQRHPEENKVGWAVIVGQRCSHRGYTILPDIPGDFKIGRYKFVQCKICLNHYPNFGWAVPKYRKCCKTSLSVHENSEKHQHAVRTAAAKADGTYGLAVVGAAPDAVMSNVMSVGDDAAVSGEATVGATAVVVTAADLAAVTLAYKELLYPAY